MDEHVPRAVTEGLRRRGVDVLTAQEAGRLEIEDREQLRFAAAEGRVAFSQDTDFLRLHAEGEPHRGIAYAPQQTAIGVMVRPCTSERTHRPASATLSTSTGSS